MIPPFYTLNSVIPSIPPPPQKKVMKFGGPPTITLLHAVVHDVSVNSERSIITVLDLPGEPVIGTPSISLIS